jgi:ABC-type transport system involved in multi-copper enzyme maturation permease subunit
MKGLLVKDLRLALKRKQQLFILLAVCAMIAFTSDGSFIVAYAAGLTGILGLSTFAYDEHDNGLPFLLSLPVDAKTYVREKFLFCTLADLAGTALGTGLYFAACSTTGKMDVFREDLPYLALYVPSTLLLIFSVLLIQMKFGIERSRLITFLLYGFLFVLAAVIVKTVGPLDQKQIDLPGWVNNPCFIAAGAFAVTAVLCSALYRIGVWIMKNKEF